MWKSFSLVVILVSQPLIMRADPVHPIELLAQTVVKAIQARNYPQFAGTMLSLTEGIALNEMAKKAEIARASNQTQIKKITQAYEQVVRTMKARHQHEVEKGQIVFVDLVNHKHINWKTVKITKINYDPPKKDYGILSVTSITIHLSDGKASFTLTSANGASQINSKWRTNDNVWILHQDNGTKKSQPHSHQH